VTGYGRTLSYQIAPRVAAGEARALVRFAQPSDGTHRRIGDPRLLLFPYHRLTGLELRWTRPPAAAEEEARRAAARREVAALTTLLPARPRPTGPPVFAGRWVERTVGACADDGLVPYSLGVRPSVLRLELFRPEALGATAVVAPALAADAALGLGAAPQPDTLHLNLIDRRLAVVYFPFWLVDVRTADAHRTAVVDGTAGTIVTTDVDPDRIARLAPAAAGSAPILGFRPLACPNCGWDRIPARRSFTAARVIAPGVSAASASSRCATVSCSRPPATADATSCCRCGSPSVPAPRRIRGCSRPPSASGSSAAWSTSAAISPA
jgi:hypothetical protein